METDWNVKAKSFRRIDPKPTADGDSAMFVPFASSPINGLGGVAFDAKLGNAKTSLNESPHPLPNHHHHNSSSPPNGRISLFFSPLVSQPCHYYYLSLWDFDFAWSYCYYH